MTPACSRAMASDSGRWSGSVTRPRPASERPFPARVHSLRNADLPTATPVPAAAQATGSLLGALERELIDWGTQIGCARAVEHAERLVPGVSVPYLAWQTFASLSEASRGNMGRALQLLPFATVGPPALLDALAHLIAPLLPAALRSIASHQPVVIGLAICALLHQLSRRPDGRAVPSGDPRALRMLQGLRTCITVLAGLQGLVDTRGRPSAIVPASAHATRGYDPTCGNRTQDALRGVARAFPLAHAQMHNRPAVTGQAERAWCGLLPVAEGAAKGRPAGGPPAKPPAKGKVTSGCAPTRKSGFTVRRLDVRRNGIDLGLPGRGTAELGPRKSIASGAATVAANKEVVMAPATHRKVAAKEQSVSRGDRKRPPAVDALVPAAAGADAAGKHPASSSRDTPLRPAGGVSSDNGISPPLPAVSHDIIPNCIRFHDPARALLQIRHARFDLKAVRFCTNDTASSVLEQALSAGTVDTSRRGEWLVPLAIRERVPPALRRAGIRKYSGVGQMHHDQARMPLPLGSDDVYAVMSISALSHAELPLAGTRLLVPNGFTLVRHSGLDGTPRIFLTYFIQPASPAAAGVKAGILEVDVTDRSFSVVDEVNGYRFFSDNLRDFIAGIEKISGCRYRAGTGELTPQIGALHEALPQADVANLFVDGAALHAAGSRDALEFNAALNFFAPVAYEYLGGLVSGVLYRNCFTFVAGDLLFVDGEGRMGTVGLSTAGPAQDALRVGPHEGFEADFIRAHGLEQGATYAMKDIILILQNFGMDWVPRDRALSPVPDAGLDFFEIEETPRADIERTGGAPSHRNPGLPRWGDRVAPTGSTAPAVWLPATYRFVGEALFYVDPDGIRGTLHFERSGRHGHLLRLAGTTLPGALRFANEHGLRSGEFYARQDILLLLWGHGLAPASR